MANDVPVRDRIPENMKWNLTPLYANAEEWEKDFKKLPRLLKKFQSYRGRLAESAEVLREAFEAADALDLAEEKLGVYAHLKHDEDTADAENAGRADRISAKGAEISGETAWFDPELMAIPKRKFDAFRKSAELAFYRRTLDETDRDRKHTLSEPEERLLGLASDALSNAGKVFSVMNDADLRFPAIKNARGKKVEVTHGNYLALLEDSDRRVRRDAFAACYDTYGSFKNTFAAILDGTVKSGVLEAKLRHYPSALAAALADDNIPVSVYTGLIDSIHAGLPHLHRYFSLRAKALGLDKLDMFDIHNPLVPAAAEVIPFGRACDIVRRALRPLGDGYGAILEHAFTDGWIDVRENRGKRSGAYSSGFFRTPPYLLLNHMDNLESVFTLVHELGHSMHSYHSDRAQEYHYAGYRIFAAEVASTTNELLLYHDLMAHAQSREVKAYLVNYLLNTIRGTAYRQTMFAEFEKDIYAWSEADKPLTADALSDRYFELNKQYHGPAVEPDDRIRFEWARIPHFHYGFYVYQYATGISAAAALSRDILAGRTDRYFGFLRAGDSKDVIDILKDAGVDFTTSAPVDACMKLFGDTVSELEKLLKTSK